MGSRVVLVVLVVLTTENDSKRLAMQPFMTAIPPELFESSEPQVGQLLFLAEFPSFGRNFRNFGAISASLEKFPIF